MSRMGAFGGAELPFLGSLPRLGLLGARWFPALRMSWGRVLRGYLRAKISCLGFCDEVVRRGVVRFIAHVLWLGFDTVGMLGGSTWF